MVIVSRQLEGLLVETSLLALMEALPLLVVCSFVSKEPKDYDFSAFSGRSIGWINWTARVGSVIGLFCFFASYYWQGALAFVFVAVVAYGTIVYPAKPKPSKAGSSKSPAIDPGSETN